jgi:hypothetical protein
LPNHLSHAPSCFCCGQFWDRVLLFPWINLDGNPPICTSPNESATAPSHWFRWGLANFFPSWPPKLLPSSPSLPPTGLNYRLEPLGPEVSCIFILFPNIVEISYNI